MALSRRSKNGLSWRGMTCALFACTAFSLVALTAAAQDQSATQTPAMQAPAPAASAQTSQQGGAGGPENIHIVVGHSLLIRTPSRVKRILTGNPAVIESVVTSPAELVITAKTPGSSSLMLWDETGRTRSLDVYADLDVSSLRNSLDESFPSLSVDVQSEADKVVLVGTVPSKDIADQMVKMADNFSKEVVDGLRVNVPPPLRQKQVILKVRFAEADRTKMTQWGFNLFSTGAANTVGTVSTQQFGPLAVLQNSTTGGAAPPSTPQQFSISDLLNIFIFRPDINLGATIAALQEKDILQILSEPNLMALSGQPAHFLAGGEFPYPVVQGGTAGSVPAITIQFRPYGVKLEFVGTIEDNNTIRLKVAPEVSTLDYSNAVTISGFVLPAISTRRAETEIELKDGQSFGIAGLLDKRATVELSKVPGIGDIPILGELFKSRNVNFTNTELLVLVTPTIVDPVEGQPATAAEPQVTMPVQPMDSSSFDKGLPYAPQNPGTAK